jgi:hypothetical protein
MPSHRANAYGTAIEYKMAEKYGLELERESWRDAVDSDGRPVEIKAAMRETADGQPGSFKIYRQYHEKLRSHGGHYVLAVYRRRGTGVQVLATERRHASRLPLTTWHGGGDHRDTQQGKVPVSVVLG